MKQTFLHWLETDRPVTRFSPYGGRSGAQERITLGECYEWRMLIIRRYASMG